MADITEDDVKHIAQLSRLRIKDEELSGFAQRFKSVIEYFDILDELDLEGVEPTSQVTGLKDVMREDEERRFCDKEKMMGAVNLPKERGQIKVKSVF